MGDVSPERKGTEAGRPPPYGREIVRGASAGPLNAATWGRARRDLGPRDRLSGHILAFDLPRRRVTLVPCPTSPPTLTTAEQAAILAATAGNSRDHLIETGW